MGRNDVIVGMGSNIDPLSNLEKALRVIEKKFPGLAASGFVETAPLGFKDQAHFYNGALRFKTEMDRVALKSWLLTIEKDFGRIRTANKNGPRTLDLDLLVWNGKIVDKDVPERDFLQNAIEVLWPGLIEGQGKNIKHRDPLETSR